MHRGVSDGASTLQLIRARAGSLALEDQALAAAAAAGDRRAFTVLVERYRRYLYAIAYRIVLDEDDALDAVQNTLLQLARKIGDFGGRGSFRGWLAAIAVRQALDLRRREGRAELPTDPGELATLADRRHPGAPGEAREALVLSERRERVAEAMGQLSAQQRAIFALRFYEELGPAAIAERLGLPAPQVRAQLSRAVARLRQIIAEE